MVPQYIDSLNEVISSGKVTYDVAGIRYMFAEVLKDFQDDTDLSKMVRENYTPEFKEWMEKEI